MKEQMLNRMFVASLALAFAGLAPATFESA